MLVNPDLVKAIHEEYARQFAYSQLEREVRKANQQRAEQLSKETSRWLHLLARFVALFRVAPASRQPDAHLHTLPNEK
ncbi:MAG: hypothetical protein KDE47_19090 [Caldilineaceae bacterium]|nr:hypothetical protein [Caldilineaceae bacterium]MCB1718516.1 hypothetical protein [Candidatus Competibacteraceae bacterium]